MYVTSSYLGTIGDIYGESVFKKNSLNAIRASTLAYFCRFLKRRFVRVSSCLQLNDDEIFMGGGDFMGNKRPIYYLSRLSPLVSIIKYLIVNSKQFGKVMVIN